MAIVGMSCRFPGGAGSPEELWELLAAGTDAISGFPADRGWDLDGLYDPDPDHPGTSYARQGGFVHDVAGFDRGVLRDQPARGAGDGPAAAAAARGVLGGARAGRASTRRRCAAARPGCSPGRRRPGYGGGAGGDAGEGYLLTGNATSVLSGRVAYTLGLEGPAVTLDTACSSSLVALHLACQALRSGECDAGAGRRRHGAGHPGRVHRVLPAARAVGRRAVQVVRRGRGRVRVGRGRGRAGAGAAVGRARERAPGAGGDPRQRAEPGRGVQRADRAERAVAAAGDPGRAGGARGCAPPRWTRWRRTGRARRWGIRSRRRRCLRPTGRAGRRAGRCGWASVKSNIGHTAGGGGGGRGDQDGAGAAAPGAAADAARGQPSPHVDWSAGEVRLLTEPVPWPADGTGRGGPGSPRSGSAAPTRT